MAKDFELETYLKILPYELGIYLFDKKELNIRYKEEINLNNKSEFIDLDILNNFLEKNIYKIEKLTGTFIKNIFLVIESDQNFHINISLKRKNYDKNINRQYLEKILTEAKDLFKENYKEYQIMHMIINKYILNEESYSKLKTNLISDHISLEVNFICIPKKLSSDIDKTLEKYHIQIDRFLDSRYINSLFVNNDFDQVQKFFKVLNGYNDNEVTLIPKNPHKIGFFEKFFQLFS